MTRRTVLLVLVSAIVLAALAGCKRDADEVVGTWPPAGSERSVPKPVEPPRWPLTGVEAPSEEDIVQRVVSVKIENSSEARPHTNIQLADVVYETVTEGGITRFNALYHSQAPAELGPVRSARLADIHVVSQYNALFAFSGASPSVTAAIRARGLEDLSQDSGVSGPYRRSRQRSAPHNLYGSVPEVRAEAARRGMAATAAVTGLAFERRASAEATPTITQVTLPFSTANTVTWTYDPATGAYLRMHNGRPFQDIGTGTQVRATNVVVMWARHNVAGRDVTGSTTFDIILTGSGRVSVFRNGQRHDGTWEATADAPPTFKAADGTQIKLTPGNTWIQVLRPETNINMQ